MFELAPVIGHRGLAAENTLVGMARAHQSGLRWVEADIRLSADHVAVLSHDETLSRCGGGLSRGDELTAAQLQLRTVACGFAHCEKEGVPILAQILALLNRLQMGLVAEIKPCPGREKAAVAAMARDLQKFPPPKIIIASFSVAVLLEAKNTLPEIARALNSEQGGDLRPRLEKCGAQNLHCRHHCAPAAAALGAYGYGLYCYTVNEARRARELFAMGIHGVFSDKLSLPEVDGRVGKAAGE